MNSVELFAGAGGLALGVSRAGFKNVLMVEWNKNACDTIRRNKERGVSLVSDWRIIQSDAKEIDYKGLSEPVDLIAGGPPCQPFSLGGKHGGPTDRRDMFPEAVRAVRELAPKAFIFENVKGLKRQSFARYFQYIYLQLSYPDLTAKSNEGWEKHLSRLERHHTRGGSSSLGYRVVIRLLNAADYGVPQRRERVFIVGIRDDLGIEWSFPESTYCQDRLEWDKWISGEYWERHQIAKKHRPTAPEAVIRRLDGSMLPLLGLPWKTVRDAISDLPDPTKSSSSLKFPDHRYVSGARSYPGHTGSRYDEPAKTLKAGDHGVPGGENMLAFEDGRVRYFTVRESARLQTFPDEYTFVGSWTEAMRQLGNAVPADLGQVVASHLMKHLKRKMNKNG